MSNTSSGGEVKEISLYGGAVNIRYFEGSRRRYMVNGKRALGVTTVIGVLDKPQLIPWAVGLALDFVHEHREMLELDPDAVWEQAQAESEKQKEQAANIGSLIHEWVEQFAKGLHPAMPEDVNVLRGVVSFLDWVGENEVTFLGAERIVYSKEHEYVGTMDIPFLIKGEKYLGDLKTGNGLYPGVAMQTAAYQKADTEESGVAYKGRWALRVSKETQNEYLARMEKKNTSRVRRGLKPVPVKPYQAFEALYLGNTEDTLETDFKAFLACKNLYRWNQEASKLFRK